MNAGDKWKLVQKAVGVTADGIPGGRTASAIMDSLGITRTDIIDTEKTDGRHINGRGLDLVKSFESLFLSAYKDFAGIWTIGYGHTGLTHKDGTVYDGREITEAQALDLLAHDMEYFEARVVELVDVDVNDDMFSALVSFAFNCGEGNLSSSTLLKRVNSRDFADAPDQFLRWNKSRNEDTGELEVLNGLTRRRASESRLFEGLDNPYIASVEELGNLGYNIV